jgi:TorA maturation chaperone TorD
MADQEKEDLCLLIASLFSPPDEEMVEQIHEGVLYSFFEKHIQSWEGETRLLDGFLIKSDPGILLKDLKKEYDRAFSGLSEEGISLVESFYKPWTKDHYCPLLFASSKGLLMGDSALHLLEIYRTCNLEVNEEFKGRPDHIVLELEFLFYLYRWATDREIRRFIEDHLDWVPLLKEELMRLHPHPFYRSVLEILDLFLTKERKRLELNGNG